MSEDEAPPNEEPPRDDIGTAAKAAAILGGILAAFALPISGPRAAVSVLVGAAIAVANLVSMRAIIRALVRSPDDAGPSTGQALWALFAALKILLLFGGIWLLLTRRLVDPMPLVVGYGVLPLGIAASAVWPRLGR